MPIQIFLTLILLAILSVAVFRRRTLPLVAAALFVICIFGILLVWFPELSTKLALLVGVGRGTDLIVYCFIVAALLVSIWLLLSIKILETKITALSREIAIMGAQRPPPRGTKRLTGN